MYGTKTPTRGLLQGIKRLNVTTLVFPISINFLKSKIVLSYLGWIFSYSYCKRLLWIVCTCNIYILTYVMQFPLILCRALFVWIHRSMYGRCNASLQQDFSSLMLFHSYCNGEKKICTFHFWIWNQILKVWKK